MKDKIFNALKQEYARLGLGDNILLGLAEILVGSFLVTIFPPSQKPLKPLYTNRKNSQANHIRVHCEEQSELY